MDFGKIVDTTSLSQFVLIESALGNSNNLYIVLQISSGPWWLVLWLYEPSLFTSQMPRCKWSRNVSSSIMPLVLEEGMLKVALKSKCVWHHCSLQSNYFRKLAISGFSSFTLSSRIEGISSVFSLIFLFLKWVAMRGSVNLIPSTCLNVL
jgi:hypothetical protein